MQSKPEILKMRITGGKYRGRKIIIPEGNLEIRPAMDRMRESLFDILGPLEDVSFCDLFTGSGSVGLEAASRGASVVDIVELDRAKAPVLKQNVSFVDNSCDLKIFFEDAVEYIKNCTKSYDIVYADPPFPMPDKLRLMKAVDGNPSVVKNGLFIVHLENKEESLWPVETDNFILKDRRLYGRNLFLFYGKKS